MKRCLTCDAVFDSPEWDCPACHVAPALLDGFLSFAPQLAAANTGFGAEFFDRLAPLEEGQFWFESRNALITWAIEHYYPRAATFLEVGCGTGFVLSGIRRNFPDLRVAASEIYSTALPYSALRLPGVDLFQMDARRIPFRDEFDLIGAFDVLEHIEDDQAVLREMYAAVRPGGGIILTVPQHPFLWSAVDDYSFHKRRYTRPELERKVLAAGFTRVTIISFISLLLPLLLVSRIRRRQNTKDFDPCAELKLNGWLNGLLTSILSLERALIGWGVSFPAGGSVLLVAWRLERGDA